MPYSHSNLDFDRALDNLGFSYLDDVPFCIDPRLQAANVDLEYAESLLAAEPPSLSVISSLDFSELGKMEQQFIKHLDDIEAEKKSRKEKEDREISEYLEKKKLLEEEKLKLEEEKKTEEEEKKKNEQTDHINSHEADKSTKTVEEETKPPDAFLLPKQSSDLKKEVSKETQLSRINYSEFEGESDPFERAELQTLDDIGILATVLQTTSVTQVSATPSTSVNPATSTMTTPTPATQIPRPSHSFFDPHRHQFYPHINYPMTGQMNQFHQISMPDRSAVLGAHMMNQNQWLVSCTPPASTVLSTPMKSSKSYGDLLSEMKKEQAAQNFYFPPNPRQSARKLSSQTPPPPSKQELTSHNKIDEWMTWPDLEGHGTSPTKSSFRTETMRDKNEQLLESLSFRSAQLCRQLHEMGFPLKRLVSGCKNLGDNQEMLIKFCLLVENMTEKGSFVGEAVEKALLAHNLDEKKAHKHLTLHSKMTEFGFDDEKIHSALVECELDYEKALEKLLE